MKAEKTFGTAALGMGAIATTVLAGPDSTAVTKNLSGSSLMVDRTGDCYVTDTDVAVSALLNLNLSTIGDLDADGTITANDKIEAIKNLILKSYGDVNGDQVIDLDDVAQAMQDAGAGATVESDANTDGTMNGDDVLYIVNAMGEETPWYLHDVASDLYYVVSQIEAEGGANAFMNVESCVAGDDPYADDQGPESHRVMISDSWYGPGGDHERSVSRQWPANHEIDLSRSWESVDHSVSTSRDEQWPANHKGAFSCTWSQPAQDGSGCSDYEHSFAISQAHPGEHSVARSEFWKYAPGHLYSRSQTWPTDPNVHRKALSWTWPPNHYYDISRDGGVSNHEYEFSHLDWPGDHSVARSQDWPPSHTYSISQSWAPGHSDAWSFRWPPTHDALVSSTWNPDSYPIGWPPNHSADCSDQQNHPRPWDEVWPPGHTRWDSMHDILDLVPPLLPDQWWPL